MAPTSSKQHSVNVGVNAAAAPFQQASGYGSHGYSTGEALTVLKVHAQRFHSGRAPAIMKSNSSNCHSELPLIVFVVVFLKLMT